MALELTRFDVADYLETDAERTSYMNACLKIGDSELIADAIGVIARSRGMTQIAKEAEVSRESLYKSLSKKGNPEFATILKLMAALDLTLCVKQKRKSRAKVAVKSATKSPTKVAVKPATKSPTKVAVKSPTKVAVKSTAKSSVKSPAKRPTKQPTQAAHPA